jgi:hypothetical protein
MSEMDPVNLLGVLLGVGALALIVLAIFRGEFREIETPKYEMLGREPPQEARPARPGRLGIEDRIIRLGLAIAGGYYASRFGLGTLGGVVLAVLALYLGVTALLARDYLYKIFHIDTRLPEHRS